MNWYYVEQGQQAGPVDDAQFAEMERVGKIQPDTLVWREGMAEWQPCQQARGGLLQGSQPLTAVAEAPPGLNQAACAECGRVLPVDEMLHYANAYVCAASKPLFMQKLSEGAPVNTGEMRYANFGIRFVAKFIDGILLRVVLTPLALVVPLAFKPATPSAMIVFQIVAGTAGALIAMAYTVVMTAKYGATLGKMACKLKIVTPEGGRLTWGRAFGRFFAEILSGCPTLMIGYIMAGFDDQRRALHDRICNTRVVHKQQ